VGRSIQVDPGFDYFKGRSAESVASELAVNGYRMVRYVVTDDDEVDDKLIEALHARGMAVWYETFGNGFYGGPAGFPSGWQAWQMKLLNLSGDQGYTFLSLSHPAYRKWKQARVVGTMRRHAFDGVEIVEPFQMGWDGPEKGLYGDLSPAALTAFRNFSGFKAPPEFKDANSPRWYKRDRSRYRKWVEFRVHEVNEFLRGIALSVRRELPGKPLSVWALANTSPDKSVGPVELAREWQGIDAVAMARATGCDEICFQTNWPDWSNPSLPSDYPLLYKPFIEPLRRAFPKLPFIIEADYGSSEANRRSREWIAGFEKACTEAGAAGSTAYMYSIAGWNYTEPPQVREAVAADGRIKLVFQKRLERSSAEDVANYILEPPCKVAVAHWDGNEVTLDAPALKRGSRYRLRVSGVKDDPKLWIFKGKTANACDQTIEVGGS
jgi:hypothetical protein